MGSKEERTKKALSTGGACDGESHGAVVGNGVESEMEEGTALALCGDEASEEVRDWSLPG